MVCYILRLEVHAIEETLLAFEEKLPCLIALGGAASWNSFWELVLA